MTSLLESADDLLLQLQGLCVHMFSNVCLLSADHQKLEMEVSE